mmetsp:Transcript_21623/g.55635  ORF Transcript_21623/g.55635 Transcript_21623/m.55635 type:complete len:117 (+) Transcript_21623:606-956(+)
MEQPDARDTPSFPSMHLQATPASLAVRGGLALGCLAHPGEVVGRRRGTQQRWAGRRGLARHADPATFDPVYEHDKYFHCLVGAAALAVAPMAQRRVGVRRAGAARRAGSPLPAGGI